MIVSEIVSDSPSPGFAVRTLSEGRTMLVLLAPKDAESAYGISGKDVVQDGSNAAKTYGIVLMFISYAVYVAKLIY